MGTSLSSFLKCLQDTGSNLLREELRALNRGRTVGITAFKKDPSDSRCERWVEGNLNNRHHSSGQGKMRRPELTQLGALTSDI